MTTNFYTLILLALLTSSIACTNNSTSLQLTNPNDESRYDESVVITRAEIAQRIGYNLQNQIEQEEILKRLAVFSLPGGTNVHKALTLAVVAVLWVVLAAYRIRYY